MSLFAHLRRFVAPPASPPHVEKHPLLKYAEEELLAFEQRTGIRLPQAYRDYLKGTGAGGKVCALEEWCQPYLEEEMQSDFLQAPFPHQAAWNDIGLRQGELGWKAPYYAHVLFQGSMRIVNTGCESYHLLVVSGPEAGNLWHDDRACNGQGIYPLVSPSGSRLSFAEYLTLPVGHLFPAPV